MLRMMNRLFTARLFGDSMRSRPCGSNLIDMYMLVLFICMHVVCDCIVCVCSRKWLSYFIMIVWHYIYIVDSTPMWDFIVTVYPTIHADGSFFFWFDTSKIKKKRHRSSQDRYGPRVDFSWAKHRAAHRGLFRNVGPMVVVGWGFIFGHNWILNGPKALIHTTGSFFLFLFLFVTLICLSFLRRIFSFLLRPVLHLCGV